MRFWMCLLCLGVICLLYAKLALRNVRRSIKDYGVYFVTLSLTTALLFSFISMSFSERILTLSENMSGLSSVIWVLSLMATIVTTFTVSYVTKFIVEKRKREFATYLLLGMERRQISNMFCIENALIGFFAFFLGIFLGSLFTQALTAIILNIFEQVHTFNIFLSWKAVLATLLCFTAMYGINIFRTGNTVRRQKIIDLLYSSRWNESAVIKNPVIHIVIIIVSILLLAASFCLLKIGVSISDNKAYLLIVAVFTSMIVGLIGAHNSLPYLFVWIGNHRKNWKYSGVNLVLLRQIATKINLHGRTMGVLSILLTFALIGMSMGLSLGAMYKVNIKAEAPFDIGIGFDMPLVENFDEIIRYVESTVSVKDYVDYQIYNAAALPDLPVLALSDYNKLRGRLGLDENEISNSQFLIHCDTWIHLEKIREALLLNNRIEIGGETFFSDESLIFTEPFEQFRLNGTNGYALILPDYIISELMPIKSRLVISTAIEAPQTLRADLNSFIRHEWQPLFSKQPMGEKITMSVSVKSWSVANGLTALSTLSFGSIYLSLIFMILMGTILALQQISMGEKGRYNYSILKKMGVDGTAIQKLVKHELLIAFFVPCVIPVALVAVTAIFANAFFGKLILMANIIPIYTIATLLVFFLVYSAYFAVTHGIYKSIVL